MRIAHFLLGRVNPNSANGVDKSVYFLGQAQAGLGHEVSIFSVTHLQPVPVPGAEIRTYPPRRLPLRIPFGSPSQRPRNPLKLPSNLLVELLDWSPDVVHFHSVHIPEAVWIARRLHQVGLPYLVTPHGALSVRAQGIRGRVKKKVFAMLSERAYLDRAVFLHAISKAEGKGLAAYGIGNTIVVAPNCLDPAIVPATLDQDLLSHRFPQVRGRRVLMYIGRLAPEKGLDSLLRAWSETAGQHDMMLVLVGPDWRGHAARLEALAKTLKITDSVLFAGRASGSEKWSLLAGADFFVHPSRWEAGVPFAVLEAIAAGKPVLVSEAADPDGLIRHNDAGLVVPADVQSLAGAVEAAAASPEEDRREMGLNALRLLEREFRWERTAMKLVSAYEEAIRTRSEPPRS
jgi:glycosyltransferase involved in cell wall biosynthesis